MTEKGEHRRVENTEDFTQWEWGETPAGMFPSDEIIIELFKEWADSIGSEAYEKSSAIGAAIVLEELAKEGFFVLEGITDKGLLVAFMGTDRFVICDELDIVTEAIEHFEDNPQHISAHLRRLANAIDAASPPIAPDEAVPT
jgi:hypothetical protein